MLLPSASALCAKAWVDDTHGRVRCKSLSLCSLRHSFSITCLPVRGRLGGATRARPGASARAAFWSIDPSLFSQADAFEKWWAMLHSQHAITSTTGTVKTKVIRRQAMLWRRLVLFRNVLPDELAVPSLPPNMPSSCRLAITLSRECSTDS